MQPDTPDSPTPFGKYQLIDKIGMGGMAEIYKARVSGPDDFEKLLVVKKILPEFAQNKAFVNMLIAEAKVTSLLHHPNIVQIFELGEIDGKYYIAMEYVEGSDLLNVLARCTREQLRVPTEIALHIISEVCKGLAHAHAATDPDGRPLNIIHRDVSPSNVLMSFGGDVKIMDFGVASADLGRGGDAASGSLKGKLGYMSPEQVAGKPLDRRSDVFALGVVLFECLTLKRLFVGRTDVQTLMNIREANVARKFKRHSYIPRPIRDILRKALAKEPDHRYQTATDFQEAILDYLFDSRMRVSARALRNFLRQVLLIPDQAPAGLPQLESAQSVASMPSAAQRSAAQPGASDSTDETNAPPPVPPGGQVPHAKRTKDLRRVDLRGATFHLRNDGGEPFGPIGFERLTALLAARCVSAREWISVNGSDWLRLREVPAIIDLQPALFEDDPTRPLHDGPVNRVRTPHLFYQLMANSLAGKLKLTKGTVCKEIYFDHGRPVHLTSNIKSELLGALLIRRGDATTHQVEQTLRQLPDFQGRLGDNLVEAGILSADELHQALQDQFVARLIETFTWDTGWYEFFEGVSAPKGHVVLQATVPAIVMEGIRNHYSLGALRRIFDDYIHKPLVVPRHLAQRTDSLILNSQELAARAHFKTDTTLGSLLHSHALEESEATNLLRVAFALYQTDQLAFRHHPRESLVPV